MSTVFVYHNLHDRLGAACGLIHKAWAQGKDFAVYAPDPERAQLLDRLLWTQPALGFLPHCRADSPLAAETPVLIATRAEALNALPPNHSGQRLLNLDDDVPPGFARYASIIEVVGANDAERQSARQRVRAYKAEGCELQFFDRTGH